MDGEDVGLIDGSGTEVTDSGGGGDESFIETEETRTDDAGRQDSEGSEQRTEGRSEGDDARRSEAGPGDVRKGLRAVLEKDPEFAKQFPQLEKQVSRALFKAAAIDKLGGAQKFTELNEIIEAHGGTEGIQELAEEVEAGRLLEDGFRKGDPRVIEGWAKDYPDGLKRLMIPALETVERIDPERFDSIASFISDKVNQQYGVYSAFTALGELIKAGKTDDAIAEYNAIAKFLGKLQGLASKAKDNPYAHREQEFEEREHAAAERDRKSFYGSVRADVNTAVTTQINRAIRNELGPGRKIKVDVANRLRKEINAELARVVNGKAGYARDYESVMGARDHARAVRFITSNAIREVPKVVKQLVKEFNLASAGRSGANYGRDRGRTSDNGARSEARTVITGRPKTSEVDFNRTDKSYWLTTMGSHGEAWLLNGKKAKW